LIVNWTGYSIASDPMDMLIFNPTSNLSRDFSKRRVDKLLRDTKECGSLLNKDRHADNIGDKHFQNGVFLSMAHPSVSEMAGRPVPRVALTDYDRMDDDIGGDGSPYDLASKRTTTFGSIVCVWRKAAHLVRLKTAIGLQWTVRMKPHPQRVYSRCTIGETVGVGIGLAHIANSDLKARLTCLNGMKKQPIW